MAVALISMVVAQAQTQEEIMKSRERAEKLKTLCDNYPKQCGNPEVDNYGKAVYDAAIMAIVNSVQLEDFYKRQIGETKEGVTDVTIKKPTLEEWLALGTTITAEGVAVKKAVDQVQNATAEMEKISESATKEKNPMKAAKAAKGVKAATAIMEFGNVATPVLLEESAAQAKAVQQIIQTLKSSGNL